MARNSMERLVGSWARENPLIFAHRQNGQPAVHHLQVWYYTDFKGVKGTATVIPNMDLYFSPRTTMISCILSRVIHTDSKVCAF